ncbi:glycine oxidase ThiO [Hydrogenothermus marinus]|uniref:Glycine oxidase n=1 Tax=Hydrogenothermus marinus TaxID=133270 RepID=A0A3M0BHT8_9AQUI|nr:glycine oxidase ThiO [Hydrogenothermus marinus]RMA96993.1 glycine oxidase [Hydrogenothermus marinus]
MHVVIIGGGVIGLSIARALIKLDIKVSLIEKNRVGRSASWVAGGMLAPQSEGLKEGSFLDFCLESRNLYKDFVEKLEKDTGIETGYWQCGILKLAFSEEEKKELQEDINRYKKLGLKAKWLDREELEKIYKNLGEEVLGGALYEDDAQVDNRKLVLALEEFVKRNADVYEFEKVKEIKTENGKFKAVVGENVYIEADKCVVSAGAWSMDFGVDVFPLKGEMVALDIEKEDIDRVLYSSRAYLIPRKNYHRLVVGATQEDVGFKDGNTLKGTMQLLTGARDTLKILEDKNIQELWFGYRPATKDELPILGEADIENLIYATGHHRNGILLAPITAKVISEYIYSGKESRYLKEFSPLRFK